MNIAILNGNPSPSNFDRYLEETRTLLESSGNIVVQMDLRDLGLRYCTGCFDCWTQTPGICYSDQAAQEMGRVVINSDFTLWAAPLPCSKWVLINTCH